MKWFNILLVILLPTLAFAEDVVIPAPDPTTFEAPVVETQSDQRPQEPGTYVDPARPADTADKLPTSQADKNENSGVRFQSIDDLNKLGK